MTRGRLVILGVGLAALTSCGRDPIPPSAAPTPAVPGSPGTSAAAHLPDAAIVVGQTIYVPISSSIASADNGRPINLAATLTIRNLDRSRPIEISSIRYHDSKGGLVRDHLTQPIQVGPLASFDLFVRESDNSGGPSPSFLVEWVADRAVVNPIVDAVMISTAGAQGITLTSAGRVIAERSR